ncbi:uncharacterized protein LOC115241721 [Formica exsecta]|uniref:uncharacterized protein LOC115241721 n=1 Tax=Formica exsecta TaxID=72781 RepID=UPI00114146F1|nr:uncharacterized protein LOC115241721 [Formica exsecta]
MAKDSIDDILVRLDEVEKLQTELRHLVPRVTSNSSRHVRHQDSSRDTSASIRFPSLFTFPIISNFTSSSRNERMQKSAAQLNLNDKLSSGNRSSTMNLKSARGSSQRESSSARETNIFKNLLKSTDKSVARSRAGNSLASTSVASSKVSTRLTKGIAANRAAKDSQEVIRNELRSRTSKIVAREKTQRITGERSSMRLSENKNGMNLNKCGFLPIPAFTVPSSVQTSAIQIHAAETAKPQDVRSCLRRRRSRDRKEISTLIERIMKKLNYCFVDDNRLTVPYHYPGNRKPRRVQGTNALRDLSAASYVD